MQPDGIFVPIGFAVSAGTPGMIELFDEVRDTIVSRFHRFRQGAQGLPQAQGDGGSRDLARTDECRGLRRPGDVTIGRLP
ncbi:MAG: hypothetical protein J0H01_35415 [Rhizobiales bacterium]|nr:hypothetical protein [Hyphomicrobiales bacterium]